MYGFVAFLVFSSIQILCLFAIFSISNGPVPARLHVFFAGPDVQYVALLMFSNIQMAVFVGHNGLVLARLHFSAGPMYGFVAFLVFSSIQILCLLAIFPMSDGPVPARLHVFCAGPDVQYVALVMFSNIQMAACVGHNGLGPARLHVFSAGPMYGFVALLVFSIIQNLRFLPYSR